MAAEQDIEDEFFVIRFRGSKEKRDLVYDWISGYSSDIQSFAEIAPKMTVRRGANLRELLLQTKPAKKPKTLASFDDVISGRAKIDEDDDSDNEYEDDGPGPSHRYHQNYQRDGSADKDFNNLIGGPYQETKPETFHTDNDNKEDLASAIAEVNNLAAFGGFSGGNGSMKRKWQGAQGQRIVVNESIKSGLWSREHARSNKNVVSSELLKKHRITFGKKE